MKALEHFGRNNSQKGFEKVLALDFRVGPWCLVFSRAEKV